MNKKYLIIIIVIVALIGMGLLVFTFTNSKNKTSIIDNQNSSEAANNIIQNEYEEVEEDIEETIPADEGNEPEETGNNIEIII